MKYVNQLTPENFNLLKQLDRIEFRQRVIEIKKRFSCGDGVMWLYLNIWLSFFAYCGIVGVVWVLTHSILMIIFVTKYFVFLSYFYLASSIIIFVLEYLIYKKRKKALCELDAEYYNKIKGKTKLGI